MVKACPSKEALLRDAVSKEDGPVCLALASHLFRCSDRGPCASRARGGGG